MTKNQASAAPSASLPLLLALAFGAQALPASAATALANPLLFVTQPPIARELNSSPTNTFLSVVSLFGNHLPDTAHAARGGDLWLMTTNGGVVNLTRRAGFGAAGVQAGGGIAVRDPAIDWSGGKALISMVVGAPTNATDPAPYVWQIYELTNLAAVVAATNTVPGFVRLPHQPANYNNVNPSYGLGGRVLFTSDRPFNNQPWLYPQRDEYKSAPTVTGTYSLDPVSGDLKLLEHLPSGAFNPFIDSFGRMIVTRWDHLIQDGAAANDRLGTTTNGSFNYFSEALNSPTQSTNLTETFPEPDDFDTAYAAQLGVNANNFNFFFPWALDPDGGNEEVLNHVGRHELVAVLTPSFPNDPNLITATNYLVRAASGIESANTNTLLGFLQITEDPKQPGTYFGVDAQDVSIFGGTHAAGQIVTLTGPPTLNPTGMVIGYVTPKAGSAGPNALGVFRNPLPMSDGSLIAAFSSTPRAVNFGFDTNLGTASLPTSMYHFRLMTLQNLGSSWTTNQALTGGLTNVAVYWDGATLVTNAGPLWELQPVEIRARPMPAPVHTPVAPIEQQVFSDEGIDLPTFQADLAQRGLALVVSRNVTARDAADKQQPYNLQVPGGVQTLGTNNGKIYDITHLQFLEADYLRGYTFGAGSVQPGRRVLATPLQATASFNYASALANAPTGGTQIMPDGSQATIVPAGRALTWQFTGVTNESIVKERYWITFRAGEVRTCANCHGINDRDQAGRPPPTNAPLALRQLLRYWRTNAANAYTLSVSHGTGSGSFGAGAILPVTANPAPGGHYFAGWTGAAVSNASAASTVLIMATNSISLVANYAALPPPTFGVFQFNGGSAVTFTAQALAGQSWILQSSTNLTAWTDVATNYASGASTVQFNTTVNPTGSQRFFRIRSP
ncbi:MAG TPA: hypothetical protein VHB20_06465 [Verrucomicrobiae bacterium]|jgi:hypothetical protein|nr:hypothetical protein [Verrucomicrobiae bacterium]